MTTKSLILGIVALSITFLVACGSKKEQTTENTPVATEQTTPSTTNAPQDAASYDPKRGEGKYDETTLKLGDKLDAALATKGEAVAGTKCTSCHKLTEEKLVGPGWKGVTSRRTPHWIMNFITNPDPMINKDPEVQAQLELCLVRMPNQNLTDDEARQILEFMRKNDGIK